MPRVQAVCGERRNRLIPVARRTPRAAAPCAKGAAAPKPTDATRNTCGEGSGWDDMSSAKVHTCFGAILSLVFMAVSSSVRVMVPLRLHGGAAGEC